MTINDQSGDVDMRSVTLRAQAISCDVLAAEDFWGGAQQSRNTSGKEEETKCRL